MMIGNVNTNREAIVQLVVLGKNLQKQGIKAVIDTGYTGCLTLPSAIVTTLGLTWFMQQEGILGDGSLLPSHQRNRQSRSTIHHSPSTIHPYPRCLIFGWEGSMYVQCL